MYVSITRPVAFPSFRPDLLGLPGWWRRGCLPRRAFPQLQHLKLLFAVLLFSVLARLIWGRPIRPCWCWVCCPR